MIFSQGRGFYENLFQKKLLYRRLAGTTRTILSKPSAIEVISAMLASKLYADHASLTDAVAHRFGFFVAKNKLLFRRTLRVLRELEEKGKFKLPSKRCEIFGGWSESLELFSCSMIERCYIEDILSSPAATEVIKDILTSKHYDDCTALTNAVAQRYRLFAARSKLLFQHTLRVLRELEIKKIFILPSEPGKSVC